MATIKGPDRPSNTVAGERLRLGLTQKELAAKLGKDRSTIRRWEADVTKIDGYWLCKLSDLFGCSIAYLLGLTVERTPKI